MNGNLKMVPNRLLDGNVFVTEIEVVIKIFTGSTVDAW
jgi:hypothetical protein